MNLPSKVQKFLGLSPRDQFHAFLDWAAKQPPEKTFEYASNENCAKSQFGKSLLPKNSGLWVSSGTSLSFGESRAYSLGRSSVVPYSFEPTLSDCKTFGQLVEEGRKFAAANLMWT